jgi:hypothetical protein
MCPRWISRPTNSFEYAQKIEKILHDPDVAKDLAPEGAKGSMRMGRVKAVERRNQKPAVHGWLVLDKPVGLTSTQALGKAVSF